MQITHTDSPHKHTKALVQSGEMVWKTWILFCLLILRVSKRLFYSVSLFYGVGVPFPENDRTRNAVNKQANQEKAPASPSTKAPLVSQLAAITLSAICVWLRDRVVLLFKPQWEKWVNLAVWDPSGSTGLSSQGQDSPSWVREPYLLGECSFILTPCCYRNPAGV